MLKKEERQLLIGFLTVLYIIILVRNAWISDDAYISFRAIENFVAGYGPNFNPNVRVQVYTHPLWMFLISGLYFVPVKLLEVSKNDSLPLLVISLSILISSGTFVIVLKKLAHDSLYTKMLFGVAILSSKAFIDYSTSGLENPLTYLLLALFLKEFTRETRNLFKLTLISAIIATNRQDTILLILPALLLALWHSPENWKKNLRALILGSIPLVIWELFSLFYYGFLFPNTAYAKLNTGIAKTSLIMQGIDYFIDSITRDPVTLLVIALTGVVVFVHKKDRIIYIGVLLYLAYIINIGGDFMTGRFFAAPFFIASILLSRTTIDSTKIYPIATVAILVLTAYAKSSPLKSLSDQNLSDEIIVTNADEAWVMANLIGNNGITDEKAFYFNRSGLTERGIRQSGSGSEYAGSQWIFTDVETVTVEVALGAVGYAKGPNPHIIYHFALADPLLSKLPVRDKTYWRIGHFWRAKPKGYVDSLESNENLIENPYLAEYYDKLKTLIEGPLWTSERFIEIWKFNTGQYDHLIDSYLKTSTYFK